MAKSGRLELGDNTLRTLLVYLQPPRRTWPARQSNSVKKRKIRAITPFKVIEIGINRNPVCDFLLVITDILSRIVSELSQLIVQILHTLRYWAPFGRLRGKVRCSSWAHCKARSWLSISVKLLIELFSLGVTAEALRAKIDRKSAFWKRVGQHAPNCNAEGDVLTNHFCTDS